MSTLIMVAPILVVFGLLFFTQRGEKKKRAELEGKLKKGDRVITRSGIVGKLIEVKDNRVRVEIAPGVNVNMLKSAVDGLDTGDAISSAKASDKDKSDKDKPEPVAKAKGGKGGKKK
jgi:preprotein translocase subunit YajC